MIVVQSILTVLSLFGLPSILPSVHFATTIDFYFFRGSAIMRWAMFILTIITAVPVPWCGFTHKHTYKDMALDITPQDTNHQQAQSANLPVPSTTQPVESTTQPLSLQADNNPVDNEIPLTSVVLIYCTPRNT